MMSLWTSQAMLWHHRISLYKDTAHGLRGLLTSPGSLGFTSLWFQVRLQVFVHAGIDALTRPRFWSLLPSTILDWVIIIVSVSPSVDATEHAETSHECYLEYFAPSAQDRPPFGWCPWALFQLYKSTSSEVYCHRGDTSSSRWHTSHFGIPGWAPINREWPDPWKVFHLAETQVCKCAVGQEEERYTLSYQES